MRGSPEQADVLVSYRDANLAVPSRAPELRGQRVSESSGETTARAGIAKERNAAAFGDAYFCNFTDAGALLGQHQACELDDERA
jgi:hypothetical protein